MAAKFELISKYEGKDLVVNLIPRRKTAESAGYDFVVAEDTVIPAYDSLHDSILMNINPLDIDKTYTLSEAAEIIKKANAKVTLVPTGVKCRLDPGTYLELSVRSSCPLKYWLILANGVGIIDSDYYNNPDNEGEIFFQIINLSPFPVYLQKGDRIGQGIIHKYITTEDDAAVGKRIGGTGSTDNVL